MNAIRSHYISRRVCWALIVVMLSSFMPMGMLAFAQTAKTVLVFPLQNAAENAPTDLGSRATSALGLAISDTPGMDAIQFSSTSPSVRRAVSEGRVRQVDVEEGANDLATALVIGAALQVDYIVMGGVQSFTRKDTGGIEVIVSGQMYEVAPNINPATGEPIAEPKVAKAFGVSGASSTRIRQGGSDSPLITEAVRDAAGKAAAALSGRAEVSDISTAKKSKNGSYKWVLFALLIGAVAMAVNNGNGSAAPGPGVDALPPTNVVLQQNQGAINVAWRAPTGTTLTVLRYQLERADNGGAFNRIATIEATTGTFYNDYGVTNGNTYQYRIRTVYTNNTVSAYAYSGALTLNTNG